MCSYKNIISAFLFSALLLFTGCSSEGMDAILPEPAPDPIASADEAANNRVLLGMWNIGFDVESMEVVITPIRESDAHYNVTKMLLPPACDDCIEIVVNSFDPVTHILDADVTLRNPVQMSAQDIRGIIYTTDYGHLLVNDDAWTGLFDIPGGETINPFRAFAKNVVTRIFFPWGEHTEKFLIQLPVPPHFEVLTFAVDASWPTNCLEPYSIENFSQEEVLYNTPGAMTQLQVDVLDWHNDVNMVKIAASVITGNDFSPFAQIEGNTWRTNIYNNIGAPPGDYRFQLMATSINSGNLPLYKYVNVTITENPVTLMVTSPNGGEEWLGGSSQEITWAWTGEISDVKIEYSKDNFVDDIHEIVDVTENDGVFTWVPVPEDPTTTAAVRITALDDPLIWDTSDDNFNIVKSSPFNLVEITPDIINCPIKDISISGNMACIAGGDKGLQIMDITTPNSPAWLNSVKASGTTGQVIVDDGYAYITAFDSGYKHLRIVDIDPYESAYLTNGKVSVGWQGHWLDIDNNYATYICDFGTSSEYQYRLRIADVEPPDAIVMIKEIVKAYFNFPSGQIVDGFGYFVQAGGGLKIADLDPPEDAEFIKIVNPPGTETDIVVNNGYAYITAAGVGLYIIDIDPVETSSLVNTVETPGNAWGVDYYNNHCYVADGSEGLQIIQVDPPETAQIVSSVELPEDISIVAVANGYAYAKTDSETLYIIDIDPPDLAFMERELTHLGLSTDVVVVDDIVYVSDLSSGLAIIDLSIPDSPYIINNLQTPGYANGVSVEGGYAYVADFNDGLQVIDIDPPEFASIVHNVDTPGIAGDVEVKGSYAYVTDDDEGLQIINIEQPESAYIAKNVKPAGSVNGVTVIGDLAYLACDTSGLRIVDVQFPESAYILKTVDTPGNAYFIAVESGYAYIGDDEAGLAIIDVDPPESAELINVVDTPGNAYGVAYKDGYVLIAQPDEGLAIVDVVPPESAYIVENFELGDQLWDVTVSGDRAYVVAIEGGLRIIKLY